MSSSTDTHDHGHAHDDGAVHAHISDVKFLVGIFAALIVLTVITVAVSRVDLGPANSFVAILVATMKASLVATYFMHLRHDKPFNAIIFVMSFVFLGIFLIYSLNDLDTRGKIDSANGVRVYERNGEVAPGGFTPRGDTGHGSSGAHAPSPSGATASPQGGSHEAPARH
jgi:cytochrome c oxidase subunit 4